MKKTIILFLFITAICGGILYGGQCQASEVDNLIDKLVEKGILSDSEALQLLQEAQKEDAKEKEELKQVAEEVVKEAGAGIKISKHIDSLKIKGDLRLRYERRDRDKATGDDDSRDRMRTRFRIGGVWVNKDENWEVAAGLATGDDGATSTNDTWSNKKFFETGDIRLDYAYARHKLNDFTFTAGQQKNPFKTSWLLWDSDVRPAGFTANYDIGSFFITAGGYDVIQFGDNFGSLYAGQIGSKLKLGDIKLLFALAYYNYDSVFEHSEQPNVDYEFKIADLYASVKIPVDKIKFDIYGQVFNNFGADGDEGQGVLGADLDPEDENLGWVVGLDAKIGKFKCGYAYTQIEADSCVGDLKDADFGTGVNDTDLKGHRIKLGYKITDHCSLGITALLYEALELDDQNEANLYQVDLKYKF